MPIPKPKDGEKEDDFIARCMSNKTMKEEFPDNDQRLAVCFQKWKDKDKKSFARSGNVERRFVTDAEMRIKDDDEGDGNTVIGYAAVFNKYSDDLGWFKEKIQKGAFKKTIEENDIRALINHDPNLIIGRTKNKTLKLWEDDKGLGYEVKLPNTSYASDLRESISRKDITQNSFGFQTIQDKWSTDGKKRVLIEAKLFDISPVTFPAYPQTSLKLRLRELGIDFDEMKLEMKIDFDAVRNAIMRIDNNNAIDSDMDLLREADEILRHYIPVEEEPITEKVELPDHSEDPKEPESISTQIKVRLADMRFKKYL